MVFVSYPFLLNICNFYGYLFEISVATQISSQTSLNMLEYLFPKILS